MDGNAPQARLQRNIRPCTQCSDGCYGYKNGQCPRTVPIYLVHGPEAGHTG